VDLLELADARMGSVPMVLGHRGPAYLVAPSLALCGRAGRKRMILVPPGREIRGVDTGESADDPALLPVFVSAARGNPFSFT